MFTRGFRLLDAADGEGGDAGGGTGGEGTGGESGAGDAGGGDGSPTPFYESVKDQELKTWAQTKGWKDADAVLKSAFNLEKMIGVPADEVMRMPKDDAGFRSVMSKLGLPESPDKYELPAMKGAEGDPDFQNFLKNTFHKVGLPANQAKALTEELNGYTEKSLETQKTDYEANVTADTQELKKAWGNGYDRQMKLAENAAQQLGFKEETIQAMELTMGYGDTMKFFADLGAKLGEDKFVGSETNRQGFHGQMTPQEAKAAYESAQMDPDFLKAITDKSHPGHKAALAKKSQLFQLMHPE